MNRIRHHPTCDEVLHALTGVAEHLEVLWERSREVSAAPLSVSQLRAMFVLERAEPMNLRSLGEALSSSPPSVSRLCDRLQAAGFLDRSTSATNRREVELRLSERGRGYLRELRARRKERLREVIESMPSAARKALFDGLTSFHEAVSELEPRGEADGKHDSQSA
ncbi:MarR family transcriptional regulator [Saccharothrix sp. S26]|nr:MarR family transcriptional regulator [Saccharothrix sp. S26]